MCAGWSAPLLLTCNKILVFDDKAHIMSLYFFFPKESVKYSIPQVLAYDSFLKSQQNTLEESAYYSFLKSQHIILSSGVSILLFPQESA